MKISSHSGQQINTPNKRQRRSVQTLVGMMMVFVLGLTAQAKSSPNSFGVSIKNFGQINENYYRGAQPDEEEFHQLKRLGVKTIIDLRDNYKREAGAWARNAGLQYINIGLSDKRAATDEQTAYFLQVANDPNNWPVYVHCRGGRHRTGEMTAIYRITQDGWTVDQAYQEMKKYDWYSRWGHGPLKDYVYDYYKRYKTNQVGTQQNQPATRTAAGIEQIFTGQQ